MDKEKLLCKVYDAIDLNLDSSYVDGLVDAVSFLGLEKEYEEYRVKRVKEEHFDNFSVCALNHALMIEAAKTKEVAVMQFANLELFSNPTDNADVIEYLALICYQVEGLGISELRHLAEEKIAEIRNNN